MDKVISDVKTGTGNASLADAAFSRERSAIPHGFRTGSNRDFHRGKGYASFESQSRFLRLAGLLRAGFAVVADEVRKLAEKTSHSTQEITVTIGGINAGTMDAIRMIEAAVEKVKHGEALAGAAGEAILEIGSGAEKVKTGVDDISSSIREQSVASREVAANVEKIAQMSEENSHAIAQVDETAKTLKALSISLEETVRNFRM